MSLWLTVDSDGAEGLSSEKPIRDSGSRKWNSLVKLPNGSIERLIGKSLSWSDEAYEFTNVFVDRVVITSEIVDYINKRVPQTFDIIPEEGSIWKVDCIVSYPNVNNGYPVVELSNDSGSWLRLPKSLIYKNN